MASKINLLLVDDEGDFLTGLTRLLSSEFADLRVLTAQDAGKALELLAVHDIRLVITDYKMPGMDGISLLHNLRSRFPEVKVILLTGYGTIEKAVEAVRHGAFDFLTKPVSSQQLYSAVKKAREFICLEEENSRLRNLIEDSCEDGLLGESAVMRKLRSTIAAVAASNYPVLILGESGTGKELAARMIHRLSNRADRAYIAVNCPAIPDNLLESELFGYKKGAFTGAMEDREGLILSANRGSLHLDEIGDISLAMQTKLLRFLQDGEVRPLGASANLASDVRVIASTNQQLLQKITDGSFRADLYYRLNVVTIHLPPLRERREDIGLLANFFLEQTCSEIKRDPMVLDPGVVNYMASRPWPGNVRELQNFIRRLAIFAEKSRVSMSAVQQIESPDLVGEEEAMDLGAYKSLKKAASDEFSSKYLQNLLTQTEGDVSEAARISGLSRLAIQKLCQRLGLSIDTFRP